MPELPEVETIARDLQAQITGRTIAAIEHLDWPRMIETPEPDAFTARLPGRTIQRVSRRAKWLLLALDGGLTLAVHLRMSGALFVTEPGEPVDRHVRMVLALDDDRKLIFRDVRKFGRLRLLDAAGLAALDAAHGPEPLAEGFDLACVAKLLALRTTRIKPYLLDQTVVAGLGNIYVDEALWQAKIHPERPAGSLTAAEVAGLHAAIREVLTLSIERKGSTLRDYRTGYGEAGDNQQHFRAYGRTGEPCPLCGTPIVRSWVAQRGTHHCPNCQLRG